MAETVRIFNWEEYLAPDVIAAFERESGHKLEQFYLDNEEQRDALILSGRGANFDLVIIDSQSLKTEGKKAYFATLPMAQIPNSQHLSPALQQACGNKGLAYSWGTIGVAYRASANPQGIDSWASVFAIEPANQYKTVMLSDSVDSTALSLIALGLPPYSVDKNHLKQAYALLQQQKAYLHSYGYGLSYVIDKQAASDITMAVTYSGDIKHFISASGQQDWRYSIPKEGTIIWTDCLAIPHRTGAIKKATLAFLNFINRPDIALLNAQTSGLATPNLGALALADDSYSKDDELFPSPQVLANSHYAQSLPNEQLKLRSRMLQKLNQSE
ncbi:spermidine/putrescine ABC transporter substrate-binding protein [Dasania phycosphaerae]|uniref:Spermidine/putrescine ABC transporter substrate-binding protein n=2 Tax=Dasania TaxID=503005 RepID=A0A9J6RHD5_9GAMM|nr:spermidine/putrescine ABC transporter substrate-binding protein [Dasania phycosphaerae]MCZ0863745.1 spermidine/putrescine ABC transporter substrate-binding protein [Dasania phycosphaerae]